MAALVVLAALSSSVYAVRFDAPFVELQKKNKAKWAAEDKKIDEKLGQLEKRFGKKPNIIYILADDVGWGEMGWQGGVPEMQFYNVRRDPGEKYGAFYAGLYTITPMQNLMRGHLIMIRKFPHRESEMPKGAEITPHD